MEIDNPIYHYQTLIGAFVALIAAIITVLVIQYQHHEVIRRRLNASRAILPMSLSKLFDYCEYNIEQLAQIYQGIEPDSVIESEARFRDLPEDSILNLSQLVELADSNTSATLQAILKFMQIQKSRLHGFSKNTQPENQENFPVTGMTGRSDILDLAILRELCGIAYGYARWETNKIDTKITQDTLTSSIMLIRRKFPTYVSNYVRDGILNGVEYALHPQK